MKLKNFSFLIITGLSGAGKTQALKCLEDFGFFCVDNLPVELILKFIDFVIETNTKIKKIAVGIDARGFFIAKNKKKFINSIILMLEELKIKGIDYKIIYLDADTKTIVQRFSETRRKHPLGENIIFAIKKEQNILKPLKVISNNIVDTSSLTLGNLKSVFASLLGIKLESMSVNIVSFGYKYGIPIDADIIIDLRFLPNPNYVRKLKCLTGNDRKVKNYLYSFEITGLFMKKFFSLIDFLIPHYFKEGKSSLTIGCGCTGGKHRSVMIANELGDYLKKKNCNVRFYHRDINK